MNASPLARIAEEYAHHQDWEGYSPVAHAVWSILYRRRMEQLEKDGSRLFLDGARAIGLNEHEVPNLDEVNGRLQPRTGWRAVPVTGFLPARQFFLCLANRCFPTTVIIRSMEQLDYLEEPDIFHDVFGHVPLHADPVFSDFLQRFGAVAARARTEEETTQMARLFWFTVEFGLIQEDGRTKVYGSGLISSHADAKNALGPTCERRPFELEGVLGHHFEIDRLQDVLYVVEDFEQLFEAVRVMESRLPPANDRPRTERVARRPRAGRVTDRPTVAG